METPMTLRSPTTIDDGDREMAKKLPNVHPGEVLLEEFL
jgi:hypothetical protein